MSQLIQYSQLTDFQKWIFFYTIKKEWVSKNLDGVLSGMCMTVKMNIDIDNFDGELAKFRSEFQQLHDQKLFRTHPSQPLLYGLSDKGELYVIQKIIKPLYDAKSKGQIQSILNFFKTPEEKELLNRLYTSVNPQDPRASLQGVAEIVLKLAMPAIQIINTLHNLIPTQPTQPA